MGVNEYIVRPINPNELLARVRTQVKRSRYIEHLRVRGSMKHHQAASRFPCYS
jgi:PleD family two-component response regulator